MDEQTDMERNAKTGQKEREEMERNKESLTLNIILSEIEREREVSLVITHTDREEDKGRSAAVLSKDEAAGTTRSLSHSSATL